MFWYHNPTIYKITTQTSVHKISTFLGTCHPHWQRLRIRRLGRVVSYIRPKTKVSLLKTTNKCVKTIKSNSFSRLSFSQRTAAQKLKLLMNKRLQKPTYRLISLIWWHRRLFVRAWQLLPYFRKPLSSLVWINPARRLHQNLSRENGEPKYRMLWDSFWSTSMTS